MGCNGNVRVLPLRKSTNSVFENREERRKWPEVKKH
jgi:hypothetical protein